MTEAEYQKFWSVEAIDRPIPKTYEERVEYLEMYIAKLNRQIYKEPHKIIEITDNREMFRQMLDMEISRELRRLYESKNRN